MASRVLVQQLVVKVDLETLLRGEEERWWATGRDVDVGDRDREFTCFEDDDIGWVPEILGDRPRIRPVDVS